MSDLVKRMASDRECAWIIVPLPGCCAFVQCKDSMATGLFWVWPHWHRRLHNIAVHVREWPIIGALTRAWLARVKVHYTFSTDLKGKRL